MACPKVRVRRSGSLKSEPLILLEDRNQSRTSTGSSPVKSTRSAKGKKRKPKRRKAKRWWQRSCPVDEMLRRWNLESLKRQWSTPEQDKAEVWLWEFPQQRADRECARLELVCNTFVGHRGRIACPDFIFRNFAFEIWGPIHFQLRKARIDIHVEEKVYRPLGLKLIPMDNRIVRLGKRFFFAMLSVLLGEEQPGNLGALRSRIARGRKSIAPAIRNEFRMRARRKTRWWHGGLVFRFKGGLKFVIHPRRPGAKNRKGKSATRARPGRRGAASWLPVVSVAWRLLTSVSVAVMGAVRVGADPAPVLFFVVRRWQAEGFWPQHRDARTDVRRLLAGFFSRLLNAG